jgi:hypothetical protein
MAVGLLGTDVGLEFIESAVAAWFKQAHASSNSIDGIDIRERALKIPSH